MSLTSSHLSYIMVCASLVKCAALLPVEFSMFATEHIQYFHVNVLMATLGIPGLTYRTGNQQCVPLSEPVVAIVRLSEPRYCKDKRYVCM